MKFKIESDPIPLARARFGKKGFYLPTRSRQYRELIQAAVQAQLPENFSPFKDEIILRLKVYRKCKVGSRRFGDLDNHIKAVSDAVQTILFYDDAQVVKVEASKNYSDRPRLEFEIKKAAIQDGVPSISFD